MPIASFIRSALISNGWLRKDRSSLRVLGLMHGRRSLLVLLLLAIVSPSSLGFDATSTTVVSISLSPSTVQGGGTTTGTVTLSGPAPTGGFAVSLSSGSTAVTVANSIIVQAGQTTANFTATTSPVSTQVLAGITALPGTNQTVILTVNTASAQSMSLSPASVIGGTSSSALVTLNGPAGPAGLTVALTSSSPAATIPATFLIPAGQTSASFGIATIGVTASTLATISASIGGNTVNASLTIRPAVLASFTLSPPVLLGGSSSTGTVTLSGPAGPSGTLVNLSSNLWAASVPNSVLVAAGRTSATFNVTTSGVDTQSAVSISATSTGVTEVAKLTINPATIESVVVSPSTVTGGSRASATVILNGPAGPSGTTVALSSTSIYAPIPATIKIGSGQSASIFAIQTAGVNTIVDSAIKATLNGISQGATLSILPATLVSLAVNPSTVIGGNSAKGLVTISGPAGPEGALIALAANSSSVKTPATVTIPSGQTGAEFPVITQGVGTQQVVTLSSLLNGVSQSANLTLTGIAVSSLTFSPSALVAGSTSTGTVTLASPAGTNGVLVSLSSSNPAVGIPSSASIPSGQTTATFRVTTIGVNEQTAVTLIASLYGTSKATTLIVNPPTINSLTLNPTIITGGGQSTGTVALNGQTGPAGLTVSLSSNNLMATVPASVVITNGQTSGAFTVLTSPVTVAQTATLVATAGTVTQSAKLSILTSTVGSVSVSPTSLSGGLTATGTVTLTGPAPAGGLNIKLSSSSAIVALQPMLSIPAGKASGTFLVKTKPVTATSSAIITASCGSISTVVGISVTPPAIVSITLSQATLVGGSTATGTVSLSGPAPANGVAVKLASDVSVAIVPASVTVVAGQKSAAFKVKTLPVDSLRLARISGALNGILETASMTVNPPNLMSLSLSPASLAGGKTLTGTVTIGSAAPAAGLVILLSSSNSVASTPASVTIPAGKSSVSFKVTTTKVSTKTTTTITASSNSTSKSSILTIT